MRNSNRSPLDSGRLLSKPLLHMPGAAWILPSQDFEKACTSLRRALELLVGVNLPYEAAMTRVLLAKAYRGMGDEASAELELRTARSAFEKLGARAISGESDALLGCG